MLNYQFNKEIQFSTVKEFDEGSLVEDYTVDLVDIVNTFNGIDSNVDNRNEYIFTDALEAQFTVES